MAKRPTDPNQVAKLIADLVAGNAPKDDDSNDPFAVALGRRGGIKGAKARAEALTPAKRKAIARKAAAARWARKEKTGGDDAEANVRHPPPVP